MVVIIWQIYNYLLNQGLSPLKLLDLQLPVKSVPITAKAVGSNRKHGEVYSIQHYVIKFVSDLREIGGLLPFSPAMKITSTIYD